MEQELRSIALEVEFADDDGARAPANWASWETRRTRSFLSAAEAPIDSGGMLGRTRNIALQLEMRREAGGFAGTWTCTIETKIGPWRIERDGGTVLQLKGGGAVLVSAPATGFAISCGDWRQQTWSGALTLDQFDAITGLSIAGSVDARRC